jgi:hypothetical protein
LVGLRYEKSHRSLPYSLMELYRLTVALDANG